MLRVLNASMRKSWLSVISLCGRRMPNARWHQNRGTTTLILTLDEVKNQLRLELDFTEHDAMLTQMVNAAQRSIERDYYCKLVTNDEELQALPETVRGFIADEDIKLAIQYLVSDAYLNGHTGQWLETVAVKHLLFPIQEHTV
nr:MAG TPA: head tail connector [Caudoviricetes sp.]DAM09623.1 MAG TPA: head tail connector [Caudoviricetes sp.]